MGRMQKRTVGRMATTRAEQARQLALPLLSRLLVQAGSERAMSVAVTWTALNDHRDYPH